MQRSVKLKHAEIGGAHCTLAVRLPLYVRLRRVKILISELTVSNHSIKPLRALPQVAYNCATRRHHITTNPASIKQVATLKHLFFIVLQTCSSLLFCANNILRSLHWIYCGRSDRTLLTKSLSQNKCCSDNARGYNWRSIFGTTL